MTYATLHPFSPAVTVASEPMKAPPIEVIVVDDHLGLRRGIELLLRQEGLRIAGLAAGVTEARSLLEAGATTSR